MTYYDAIAGGYDDLHKTEQEQKLAIVKELLAKHVRIEKSTILLDVGCGSGISSQFDCAVTGIDPSEELLKIAERSSSMQTVAGEAEDLPFPDDAFDVVISLTAVHNFTDIAQGLREMARVGKKTAVISVLKRSSKRDMIEGEITKVFDVLETVSEEKDDIFLCAIKYINQDAT